MDVERHKAEDRRCCICGGLFKNKRGVKIHQGKPKCKEQRQQCRATQLTQSNLSECVMCVGQAVEEDQRQEANHRAPDLPAEPTQSELESPRDFARKPRLNLPPVTDRRWAQLQNDLNTILEDTRKGDAANKIKSMVRLVNQACYDTFGTKESKTPWPPAGASRRQRQMKELRRELQRLKKRGWEASDEDRATLDETSSETRKRLIQLQRAETAREKQKEKRCKTKAFFHNPFQFTADLLGKPKGRTLSCTKEAIESSVAAAHGNSSRGITLGECPFHLPSPTPATPFNMADFTMDEVRAEVTKAQTASAPGPSGTTYKMYKRCPPLLKKLPRLLQTLWKKTLEPRLWTLAEGCFVPEELNSTRLDQFWEISLLDVEGEIFWSIIAKRLKTHLIANEFINGEGMERLCNKFLWKWLGVPPSFNTINLYSKTSKLSLPVSLVVEEFKATKARAVSTLLSSKDGKVKHSSIAIRCGRKWKPQQAIREAESHWRHQEIMSVVCKGQPWTA